jgi:glycerol-3-phosphate acyltransferase PlsX
MRIALDAMGGDTAPACIVEGACAALSDHDDLQIVLVGDEAAIASELKRCTPARSIEVVHASQVIAMGESPVDAMRQKKDSSIAVLAGVGATGQVDAVISAGNTGAFAAACQLRMRTVELVARAGIAVAIPALHGPFVLMDVGANIQPKPHHLHQYAVMADLYARHVLGMADPRVGLLSVGEENIKGTEVVKQAHELIRTDSALRFVGNIEGRDLFDGVCDVAVSDGFVGNIMLKLFEGFSRGIFETVAKEIADEKPELKGPFDEVVRAVWKRHDYTEFGGAPLLGINGVSIICHGNSDARAIRNAIRTTMTFVEANINAHLLTRLGART